MGLYFKDDYHKETALKLMKQFEFETLEDDREYGSFCYLATATYKYNDLKKVIDSQLIDLDILKELMQVYSPTERRLIRLGLQLFNSGIDNISIAEVMSGLDDNNMRVVLEAIKFRYKV